MCAERNQVVKTYRSRLLHTEILLQRSEADLMCMFLNIQNNNRDSSLDLHYHLITFATETLPLKKICAMTVNNEIDRLRACITRRMY